MTFCIRSSAVLLLTTLLVTGCCGQPSNVDSQLALSPPVLPSAVEMEINGQKGLWMNEHDVANLMVWINNVSSR